MLRWLGISFQVTSAQLDETPQTDEAPADLVVRLAQQKARAVAITNTESLILAADTVVELANQALGKPEDSAEARNMLLQLRTRPHRVHTGVALYSATIGRMSMRRVTTTVQMRPYSEAEIEAYLASGDPFDKAGSYAIQHAGFQPVQELERCYANVVGLPLCATATLLTEAGIELDVELPTLCAQHFGYQCPAIDRGLRL